MSYLYYTYNTNVTYTVKETENGLVFEVPLAGKRKEDVKLSTAKGYLTLAVKDKKYYIDVEKWSDGVDEYDLSGVKASMKDGLLVVTVPKHKEQENSIQID